MAAPGEDCEGAFARTGEIEYEKTHLLFSVVI